MVWVSLFMISSVSAKVRLRTVSERTVKGELIEADGVVIDARKGRITITGSGPNGPRLLVNGKRLDEIVDKHEDDDESKKTR